MTTRRLRAICRKEFIHIIRDPLTLAVIFAMPMFTMVLFGYAVRLDIVDIPTVVINLDQSPESRRLIEEFDSIPYFRITEILHHYEPADRVFKARRGRCILSIPRGFAEGLHGGGIESPQFVVDASDSNTATVAAQYATAIVEAYAMNYVTSIASTPSIASAPWVASIPSVPSPDIRLLVLYNPEFRSTWFIVPGLVAVIFMMICALMTSAAIVREKETGSLEQLLVSPVRPLEIIIGKLLPYVALSVMVTGMALLVVTQWFGVPFRGSLLLLAGISLVYIICALGFGMLISTVTRSMQVALMIALVSTMLPSIMLSGFMFPIRSMPLPIQWITRIVPARYFLIIIRSIMLKAGTLPDLVIPMISLAGLTVIIFGIGMLRFRNSLE
ncbi:MAG TPA: ABC transporter permease [bacterium]|nr:ABC transporter permease [bacterium]